MEGILLRLLVTVCEWEEAKFLSSALEGEGEGGECLCVEKKMNMREKKIG